ncbi:MAG: hypothetical protein WAK01_20570 [Methylocystis sp.]
MRHVDRRSCGATARGAEAAGRGVWFLFKCLVVLAVVFFLASRDQPPETQGAAKTRVQAAHKPATDGPHEADAVETLKKAAAQKLADGVKEHCLKRPEDCLSVARSLGAGLSALDKAR